MFFRIKSVCLLTLIFLISSCNTDKVTTGSIPEATDSSSVKNASVNNFLYGIPPDSFDLISGHVKRNGLISSILTQHGITMQEIETVFSNSSAVFDARSLRYGNKYTLFCNRDSTARAEYLVYEHDPTTSYVFSFNDSLNITLYKKDIKSAVRYAQGTIETSLWDAMLGGGMPPSLAVGLSEVYAWTVDFFGLQKGDSFKVIYEEFLIDDKSLGIGKIYGAQFTSSGKNIYAIPFIQDSVESFFDSDGKSLRKAFLKAPLQFSRVSSRFSSSRMHPILRIRRPHYGVDYAAPTGTPVHAIGDGRVTQTSNNGGAGRMVKIVHNSVYSTAYLHLSRFEKGIVPGALVKQGDIIGYVGRSGLATGPHLDFRFYKNGTPVDPLTIEAPSVEPVSEANMARFGKSKTVIMSLLETF